MNFIAFYLPQYHPIPENDAVYGKGFTEWDNVREAVPLFNGHYQPHIPHKKIGYYSLLNKRFIEYQHDFAYQNGITSFCYYYYNFSGKTLLESPLKIIRNNQNIKNTYCLCWAHPGWYDNSKGPGAVFLQQHYSVENAVRLFLSVRGYFEDSRYITVGGHPLFLIWAPERHPMIREYADIFHEMAVRHGFSGLCLAGVEAYGPADPSALGLDCMVEFAPNWVPSSRVSAPEERPVRMDYQKTVYFMLNKTVPPYPRMRCAFPSWDNTPRRGMQGIACTGILPSLFCKALMYFSEYTKKILDDSMQYVFINAWNEWGEGCHIEPDEQYGTTFLDIIAQVAKKV
ncbi:MAG: glycoside hydrolase family 99-like domain-containing protein [Desulfovibrio sp.]|nr:glycoside hydrolase family 99-like domain-containing protein [Desulfovibrio sp.]